MAKALAKTDGYKTLVKKITREFAELELFVKNRVAKSHWNVGKYIDEHLLENRDKPEYATGFYEELAKDTGRDRTTLQRAVQFYRAYPICAFPHKLTWEHFKGLITVKDIQERRKLEEKIIRQNWNTQKFRKYLSVKRRLTAPANDDKPVPQLAFTRGKLHTCQIVPAPRNLKDSRIRYPKFRKISGTNKSLVHRGPLALDLGFREQYAIPKDAPKLKENDTVELVFEGGDLSGVRKASVAKEEIFTYVAMVERVIDGDTLLVSLDFGCPMSVSWKLRLRGINCPEIDTEEGRRAKRFVEGRLKGCDFIIVKTYKDRTDKFDRYLADVFYAPQLPQSREAASTTTASDPAFVAREGKYLNQELLDEKLACVYQV